MFEQPGSPGHVEASLQEGGSRLSRTEPETAGPSTLSWRCPLGLQPRGSALRAGVGWNLLRVSGSWALPEPPWSCPTQLALSPLVPSRPLPSSATLAPWGLPLSAARPCLTSPVASPQPNPWHGEDLHKDGRGGARSHSVTM